MISLVIRSLKWVNPEKMKGAERVFGSRAVDFLLTADQLSAVAEAVPRVRTEKAFIVCEFVTQFGSAPRPDECTTQEARLDMLTRVFAFAHDVSRRALNSMCGEVASTLMSWCMRLLLECDGKYNFAWFDTWIALNHAAVKPFINRKTKINEDIIVKPNNFESIPHPDFDVRFTWMFYCTSSWWSFVRRIMIERVTSTMFKCGCVCYIAYQHEYILLYFFKCNFICRM